MDRIQNSHEPGAQEPRLKAHKEVYLDIFEFLYHTTDASQFAHNEVKYWHRLAELVERTSHAKAKDKPKFVFLYWLFLGVFNGWEWKLDTIRKKMLQHRRTWEEQQKKDEIYQEREYGYLGYMEWLMRQDFTPPPDFAPSGLKDNSVE
ncbi:hypothetical protein N7456_008428 [Penicillium angulare]|uniref:Uncharacterized protein n=1 Tax=Penicillium angulare TaxID=116970 RepID=A0A9W9FCM9_9EURO|nr:hypothetical protein N7456_008428 [Penicillium angulare]